MTKCQPCAGFGVINDGPEAIPSRCRACNGSGLAGVMIVEQNPDPRGSTWERLRDFFAGGGKISLPTPEEMMLDARPVRLFYGGGPGGGKTAEIERWLQRVADAMGEVPAQMGVDLAHGRSESWLVTWDAEQGKMIYRKVDPADMVRRDEEGEGNPDHGSD